MQIHYSPRWCNNPGKIEAVQIASFVQTSPDRPARSLWRTFTFTGGGEQGREFAFVRGPQLEYKIATFRLADNESRYIVSGPIGHFELKDEDMGQLGWCLRFLDAPQRMPQGYRHSSFLDQILAAPVVPGIVTLPTDELETYALLGQSPPYAWSNSEFLQWVTERLG